ncbi:LmbU family transcriptional regulator [Streptosporangium sp. NPDC049644]|uniref:LmbU family transcriptional regulator n=1 Tax=Streptosporangium sp. NPDC049644 TaxID=3155507 RepID=UPI00341F60E0
MSEPLVRGKKGGESRVTPVLSQENGINRRLGLDRTVIPRRTGLQFPTQIPFANWESIGRQLSLIADSSAWWLGDWLVYGEKQYADRYRTAIERTSLDYQTLRNYAWVARRFGLPRRRDKLSFAHHAEVAALSAPEQDLWLQRAEQHAWSRNRLRKELRQAAALRNGEGEPAEAPSPPVNGAGTGVPAGSGLAVKLQLSPSQEQLERWEFAARKHNCDLANWMVLVLEKFALEVTQEGAGVPG